MNNKCSFLIKCLLFVCLTRQAFCIGFDIPFSVITDEVSKKVAGEGVKIDGTSADRVLENGQMVPSVGIFLESKKDVAYSTGYVLVRLHLIPFLEKGQLSFRLKSEVADARVKAGGWVEWADNILSAGGLLGRLHLDKLVSDVAMSIVKKELDDANNKANATLDKQRTGNFIASVIVKSNCIHVEFGLAPGNGTASCGFTLSDELSAGSAAVHPIFEWWPPGHSRDDAVLVVTVFYDAEQLHTVASVNNGDPAKHGDDRLKEWYRQDVNNPGQNRITFYLPAGFSVPDLSADSACFDFKQPGHGDGYHKWNDKIGSMIIRPGPKYHNQKLRLGENPVGKPGFVQDFPVGYHSLRSSKLFNQASQMSVIP